jgi:hypothetical protein
MLLPASQVEWEFDLTHLVHADGISMPHPTFRYIHQHFHVLSTCDHITMETPFIITTPCLMPPLFQQHSKLSLQQVCVAGFDVPAVSGYTCYHSVSTFHSLWFRVWIKTVPHIKVKNDIKVIRTLRTLWQELSCS